MKTVAFCGHRQVLWDEEAKIKEKLYAEIERLIKCGATEFLLGGYGDFDFLCARAVKEMKIKYPHIKSIIVIPYINRDFNREIYDFSVYPPIEKTPPKFAILKRNEYMADCADVIISYVKYSWGGAAKTLEYARRKNKNIIEL